jgi:hypothetical protein
MKHIIILAELRIEDKKGYDVGVGVIKVFSNFKKAYNYIYKESSEEYTKVSYSSIAGYLAKGNERYYALDGKLGILKFKVE